MDICVVVLDGAVGGDEGVVEVDGDIGEFETALEFADVDVGDVAAVVEGHGGDESGDLSGEDGGRNDAEEIPAVALAAGGATGGEEVAEAAAREGSERNLVEEVAAVEVVDGGDGVVEMLVAVGFLEGIVAVEPVKVAVSRALQSWNI